MSLFQEFSPIFRVLNDYERAARCTPRHVPTFKPKFDVKELETSYELLGELPGVDQKDVNIEWKDATTLSISGRTEYRAQKSSPASEPETAAPEATENTESESVSAEKENESYHQPSVSEEEGDDFVAVPSQSEKAAGKQPQQEELVQAPAVQEPAEEKAKYWVSERSVGTFQRAFSFPVRVDQESVKASLKNGILSIVIPKAKIPEPRRINIE